jgi:RNA polymerase sigma-70 factor (ECF subfamily)
MATNTLPGTLLPQLAERDARDGVPDVGQVYEAHGDYVFRCLRNLGVGPSQLDDAMQDVFLVVQDKLRDFDGRGQLRTWLYAIVLRIARKQRERAARERARFASHDPEQLAEECGDSAQERLALASRALDALDGPKREMFVLSALEQLSAPEIAEVTGLNSNTVYSRIRAARLAFEAEVARLKRQEAAAAERAARRGRP